jgi:hypothetical protein
LDLFPIPVACDEAGHYCALRRQLLQLGTHLFQRQAQGLRDIGVELFAVKLQVLDDGSQGKPLWGGIDPTTGE